MTNVPPNDSAFPDRLAESKKSKRPRDIKFIQQKLPIYYPVLNAGCIFPVFFVISSIFIPLGVGIYFYAENIRELSIEYSHCTSDNVQHENLTCEEVLNETLYNKPYPHQHWINGSNDVKATDCRCRIDFELKEPIKGTVYMYYALTNFHQNHLKYYTNRDENQFKGNVLDNKKGKIEAKVPSSSCKPEFFRIDASDRPILPCGIQANSMFFDVITLSHWYNEQDNNVPLNKTGIAWESDKRKFNNAQKMDRPYLIGPYFGKPPSWKRPIWELDLSNRSNNGFENEDFIIWMKTSAFPNFRKLYRIVNSKRNNLYEDGLPVGNYSLRIEYQMTVKQFKGSKTIILTNSRELAGKNYFLAAAFLTTGILLFVLFVIFFVLHLFTKNRHHDFKMH